MSGNPERNVWSQCCYAFWVNCKATHLWMVWPIDFCHMRGVHLKEIFDCCCESSPELFDVRLRKRYWLLRTRFISSSKDFSKDNVVVQYNDPCWFLEQSLQRGISGVNFDSQESQCWCSHCRDCYLHSSSCSLKFYWYLPFLITCEAELYQKHDSCQKDHPADYVDSSLAVNLGVSYVSLRTKFVQLR